MAVRKKKAAKARVARNSKQTKKRTKKKTKKGRRNQLIGGRRPPHKCSLPKVCQYLNDITSTADLPLPAGSADSDLPWLVSLYYGYMDLYYAALRLELIEQGYDGGPPILSTAGGDKSGAPPPPKFPPD